MKQIMLADLYRDDELQAMKGYRTSRTVFDTPEFELAPELFCQPIDIAINLQGDSTQAIKYMPEYPTRSLQNTLQYIDDLVGLGIKTVMLRMDSPSELESIEEILEMQSAIVAKIRERFDRKTLTIIVDPFSVALNTDKTWGVKHEEMLHYMKTAELFADLTARFANVGADYVLTLGRFEREVEVTRRTLEKLKSPTKVASFSTNTETTNAYVYADHGAYSKTGQKIHVANYQEMVFRAMVDIFEGSELVVVKPAENLHVLERVKTLIAHPSMLETFLRSDRIHKVADQSAYLQNVRREMLENVDAFHEKAMRARLAAYTVSGTYFIDMQTKQRKGDEFLASLLYERFCNIAGVLQERSSTGLIIDRNASWFVSRFTSVES